MAEHEQVTAILNHEQFAVRDEHLQETAVKDLASAALREAQIIDGRLRSIESLVQVYRDGAHKALLDTRFQADELERQRHAVTDSGVFYTRSDDGRAASFYANSTPVAQQDHAKVMRLSQLDPLMRSTDWSPTSSLCARRATGASVHWPNKRS